MLKFALCSLIVLASPLWAEDSVKAPAAPVEVTAPAEAGAEVKKEAAAEVKTAEPKLSEAAVLAIGSPAPEFTALDSNGKTLNLKDFAGKVVVLEWKNHQCPFVVKHYSVGNMQKLQGEATADGVVWLSVLSSAQGKEGYVNAEEANKIVASEGSKASHVLMDEKGELGRLYQAQTTPHMYIIDKDGKLAYMGAIDDKNGTESEEIKTANNYVRSALNSLKEGKPVETAQTKAYGCSVKY